MVDFKRIIFMGVYFSIRSEDSVRLNKSTCTLDIGLYKNLLFFLLIYGIVFFISRIFEDHPGGIVTKYSYKTHYLGT